MHLHLRIQLVTILIIVIVSGSLLVYSFKRCGWGMLAYEYPAIAAFTGECAQQQRAAASEQQKAADK